MLIEPLMREIIDGKEFVEISNFAASGIRKRSYLINIHGEIYSLISNKYLHQTVSLNGYLVVNLKLENGGSSVFYLHRIIMITFRFIYNFEEMFVNHKNGIKTESNLDNMEWTTLQENNAHAKSTGLLCTGEKCPWSVLTEKEVREICTILENGNYSTITEIAEKYNCSITTIGDIARGVS